MGPRPPLWFFCMKNIVISIRITSVYGSQPLSVVFACKTATLAPDFQVSIYGSQNSPMDFAFKTATLAPELQVSMDPRPHLSLCACKTA